MSQLHATPIGCPSFRHQLRLDRRSFVKAGILGVEPSGRPHDVLTRVPTAPTDQLGDLLPDRRQPTRHAKMITPPVSAREAPAPPADLASWPPAIPPSLWEVFTGGCLWSTLPRP